MEKEDKGYIGDCPKHKRDYRKCEECMPETKEGNEMLVKAEKNELKSKLKEEVGKIRRWKADSWAMTTEPEGQYVDFSDIIKIIDEKL